MTHERWIACCAVLAGLFAEAAGQPVGRQIPLADPVEEALIPSGILTLPVTLGGKMAYVFRDPDGTDTLHFIGDFSLTTGSAGGPTLEAQEAIVWINNRAIDGRPYRNLEILLWRDVLILESGGTTTSGPALFVSLSTSAEITAQMDDVAMGHISGSELYRQGTAIRKRLMEQRAAFADEVQPLRVFDAAGLRPGGQMPKPKPIIEFRSEGALQLTRDKEGRQLLTVTGGVYLSRGTPGTKDFLDLRADSVVVFSPPARAGAVPDGTRPAGLGSPDDVGGGAGSPATGGGRASAPRAVDHQMLATGLATTEVESAYLEGDVVMTQGPHMVRASRLYYDFVRDRATILDAVVRTMIVDRGIPLYVRAKEIRQLSRTQYTAADAVLTTSEFHTPHYHVGATRVELSQLTPSGEATGGGGIRSGSFRIRHATLNVGGVPVGYWPFIQGTVGESETAIKSLRTGYSGRFGAELETNWHLFSVLGYQTPEGFDTTLSLDLYSERGPAIGVDADYRRDHYFGEIKSYLISDSGEDFLGRERETLSIYDIRGRFLVRHRQYLEDDWQLSLELSYISDRGFLEEYFESEFDKDKEQETLLYLKRQRENWALTALLQARLMDFTTQTERIPDLAYFRVGDRVGDVVTSYSESRLGLVRYRPGEQTFNQFLRQGPRDASGTVARVDSRHEIGIPFDVGPVRVVPFFAVRGTAWDDSPDEGGLARVFGTYGIRSSMYLSRIYPDVESEMFDIHGLRHIIKPDVVAWISTTNRDSEELYPFDEQTEDIDEIDGVAVSVRQRWQTRRGPPERRRTVDVLTLDTEVGVFSDATGDDTTNGFTSFSRPENSVGRNYVNSSLIWRANDHTAVLTEMNYDLNDGEVDILNAALVVERSPRFNYLVGYRFIEESNSNLLGLEMNYRMTEKHSLAMRELFDLARGRTLDFTVAFVRKFPRWFGALSFALDEAEDDFGVSFSIWPEGSPQAALGSRRFTGIPGVSGISTN